MSDFFASIGLPEVIAGLIVLALNAYALMGGADFGGGVWDLLASGPRRNEQRALISAAIAPIWEANHVWLIVAVVMLFTAFPVVFGMLSVVLHIPLTIMLVGIVLRGSAFVFRSYGSHSRADRRRWGRLFAIASTVTPFVLGDIVGALSSGAVSDASRRVGTASFGSVFIAPWLTFYTLSVGALALALFSFLAAVYLTVAARDSLVREDFRGRALASAAAVFVTALGALLAARNQAPEVGQGLTAGSLALAVHVATGVAAIVAVAALVARRYQLARLAAAAQVSLILWGWALAQYPFIVPPDVTIRGAAAPSTTLVLLAWALAGGAVILIPALVYLFRTFTELGSDTN